jgi:PAS domain S-box-containing protein
MNQLPADESIQRGLLYSDRAVKALSAEFSRTAELAALACDCPLSLITFAGKVYFWSKDKAFLSEEIDSNITTFTNLITDSKQFQEVGNVMVDERFTTGSSNIGDNKVSFLAGHPLISSPGAAMGCLCVFNTSPGTLSAAQKTILSLLASEFIAIAEQKALIWATSGYKDLFDLSTDMICIAGTDGFFKQVNPAFERVLGWNESILKNTSFFDFVHTEDLERTKDEIAKLASGTHTVNFIHRFRDSSGNYRSLQWVATPEPLTGNLYAIARDISEERAKELELAHTEERASIFFENSQGFMCTHDLQGRFTSVNEAGAAILGYTKHEILAMSLFDIVPSQRHGLVQAYIDEVTTTGRSKGQMVTRHKEGEYQIWQYNNILEKGPEGLPYIIGNAIDVTQRFTLEEDLKKTKDTLEQTNRVARVGGWELDVLRNRLLWTSVTREIHGMPQDYEPTLGHAITFYKQGSRETLERLITEALQESKSWDTELELINGQGAELWVRIIGNVHLDEGVHKRLYGTVQDITQEVKLREELKLAILRAESANAAKSEFLANMSHEIRTPLNGVIGFTDLVLKTHLNATQHQYLSIVNQSANALLSIINDILDFSKIEAGKLELSPEQCDIYEIAGQAADIISYQAQNKGLEMLLNIAAELPRFIYADAIRLKQILVNLLGNAAKFTDNGEIELKVALLQLDTEAVSVRFEVRDTGIGIQPEKQAKIFEAFSQEDASTTKRYGGTGLGLTISNKLLALMGSKLHLRSSQGEGSTFYFDVSFRYESREPVKWKDIDTISTALIVDDNQNNRIILEQMLNEINIRATLAKNGIDALQLMESGQKYDVVLMDYHMPYMDGLETIKLMRNATATISPKQPILLLHSSADDEKIIDACQELGVSSHLVKPVKLGDIYNALAHLSGEGIQKNEPLIPAETRGTNRAILIAEDNPVNMMLVRSILAKIAPDATLIAAENGLEALEYCKSNTPDLVLMDIQMPHMNGCEATMEIRKLGTEGRMPIVALTAGNVKGEREKCMAAGMNDFVVKPIREQDIADILSRWLTKEN